MQSDWHLSAFIVTMIGYLEGKILKREADRVLVLANQIGYEVLLPAIVMKSLQNKNAGTELSLYIYTIKPNGSLNRS